MVIKEDCLKLPYCYGSKWKLKDWVCQRCGFASTCKQLTTGRGGSIYGDEE